MTLIVEDGSGVSGAESYASVAFISTYWAARPQSAFAATWAAADSAHQEGAAREATAFIESMWGPYYRGVRRGFVQGLLWPRTDALDGAGYPLPELPDEFPRAVAELAARAVAAPLAIDIERDGKIKSIDKQVGPLRKSISYFDAAPTQKSYGVVAVMLAPYLNGSQPDAPNAMWAWK